MDLSSLIAFVPAQYAVYVLAFMGLCAAVDAVVPQPAAGSSWVPLRKIVAAFGQSYGNARNAIPAGSIPASVAKAAAEVTAGADAVKNAAGELAQVADEKAAATVTAAATLKAFAMLLLMAPALAACGATGLTMQSAIPVAAVQDTQTALNTYQAALGVAQVAVSGNPVLSAKIAALVAKAKPYVDALQTGTTMASTSGTLAALAAQLLFEAAQAGFLAVPNKAPAEVSVTP